MGASGAHSVTTQDWCNHERLVQPARVFLSWDLAEKGAMRHTMRRAHTHTHTKAELPAFLNLGARARTPAQHAQPNKTRLHNMCPRPAPAPCQVNTPVRHGSAPFAPPQHNGWADFGLGWAVAAWLATRKNPAARLKQHMCSR